MNLHKKMWEELKKETTLPFFTSVKGNELEFNLWEIQELIRTIENQVEKANICDNCEYSHIYADSNCINFEVFCDNQEKSKNFTIREEHKPFGDCKVVPKEIDKPKEIHPYSD